MQKLKKKKKNKYIEHDIIYVQRRQSPKLLAKKNLAR